MSQLTHSRPDTPPYTIGILTARLNGPNEINLWHGVAERAKERNINLIFFSGGIPHWSQLYEAQRNILFNFAGQPNVDGLMVWANILNHTLDPTGLKNFCQRYSPLPVVSMGVVIPSIQSIRIDMQEGMRKLIAHLIEAHGRKKIAFIRGPEVSQDAEDRYSAYVGTLNHYGLSIDPRLIASGDFRRYAGTAAIQQLMDNPDLKFDAVVSANDNMAIGVLQALQAHGVNIPGDVIVAGFDDIEETRATTPSLTTVRAPWHMLGSKSIDLVISQLKNEPSPEQILLETELVCRQSCGCQQAFLNLNQTYPFKNASRRSAGIPGRPSFQISSIQNSSPAIVKEILSGLATIHWLDQDISKKLVNSFVADISSNEPNQDTFISYVHETLSSIPSGTEIIEWQEVINIIQSKVEALFHSQEKILKAHYLLEKGYTLVGEAAHRQQLSERLETINQTNRLNRIVQTMSTTHDIETLMNLLAAELPRLGIQSCFLSLYADKVDNPTWSRLILAMVRKQRLPLERGGIRFPTRQLVPAGFLPDDSQFTFDVEALHFQEEQIGFVMFEIGPADGEIYTTLQGHISSALKSAELVQVALEAETKAIKSDQLKTHLLANVSHELRTPLNIILGLSHTALSSPNPYGVELPPQLCKDLGYIFANGEHLNRIINDLLDTSRAEIGELDLSYEPVSLLALLREVFETFNETSNDKQKVELILDVPKHLPVLHADPVRLRQILMNLLSNAFKFTMSGKVILGADVQLPHIHFWVSDTGSGISPELQERIFEPFVKAGTPGQHRSGIGLGLSITRRLVALHGGSITLDSVPDAGSTFHVYIPLPGLNNAAAQEVELEGATPILLWLSSNKEPPLPIQNICQMNCLEFCWLSSIDDIKLSLRQGKPVAFAWDLENARPGDWSIVQKLRIHPQFCQLPLLIFHENIIDKLSGGSRLTNVLLKPAGSQMLQHVLNLLPEALQRGEIWIIDDDPQALNYYQDLISASLSEFLVRPVRGGRDALRLLEDETPDLVLLDLMMPDIDGFQVLEQLRRNIKTAHIPVIVITGKILSYEDVKRLDVPKVILQTKGVLSDEESIAEIQRVLTANSSLPQPTSTVVKNAAAYIQQNYTRSFSLEEVSETIGVSKSYLSRIFKMDMGISPWEYLNRFRTQKAKELLLLTDESITMIAADVGYEDVGYFGRVFHDITGCSPRAFRQQHGSSTTG
jgi:signal transduction histidine kinase/DNA-binding LacI/PurR family transcriptional regulator/AraC-like DNA-binding protein